MGMDGVLANTKSLCDFLARKTFSDKPKNLILSGGQEDASEISSFHNFVSSTFPNRITNRPDRDRIQRDR